MEKYVSQIDTRTYGDYTTTKNYFSQDSPFQRASKVRITFTSIFEIQHKQMRKILIPLCKKSTEIYHLNISRIIAIIYHIYIERELYNLANKNIYYVEK